MKTFNTKEAAQILELTTKEIRTLARSNWGTTTGRWSFTEYQVEQLKIQIQKSPTDEGVSTEASEGLTKLETALLKTIGERIDVYRGEFFSDIIIEDISSNTKRDRGVLSSLIKKGMAFTDQADDDLPIMIYLTEPGWAKYDTIKEA